MMTWRTNCIMAIPLTALQQEQRNFSYKYKIQVCSLLITVMQLGIKAVPVCPLSSHNSLGSREVLCYSFS